MRYISSAHNTLILHAKKLATNASYRRKSMQTIIEGVHLCESFLQIKNDRPVLCIVGESSADNSEVARVVAAAEQGEVECVTVEDSIFSAISQLKHGVAVAFIVAIPEQTDPGVITETSLLLEDVQDPGNLGTILRTAVAAGVSRVMLSSGCASAWSPKSLRSGMGAHFSLQIYENVDLSKSIRSAKIPVLATNLEAEDTLYGLDIENVAWLFGNEGQGVSRELLEICDNTVIIPQANGVESLNVAASVAVCLFEQRRQKLVKLGAK